MTTPKSFGTPMLCSTSVKAQDRLPAVTPMTWCPPVETIIRYSSISSSLHPPTSPHLQQHQSPESERREGLRSAPLHFVSQSLCMHSIADGDVCTFDFVGAYSWCVPRVCVCLRVWFLWLGASSGCHRLCQEVAISQSLIRIYWPHTSLGGTPQSRTEFKGPCSSQNPKSF